MARPGVVIVGAGFGGLWAARGLTNRAVDVTLIDRNNYHTFFPLLYQVAAAGLVPTDIAYPMRSVFSSPWPSAARPASSASRARPSTRFRSGGCPTRFRSAITS